jgi:hypothetical protein
MFNLLKGFFKRRPAAGVFRGRRKTRDVAIQFRMQSGFAGDVNRTHPFDIEPCLIDASAPPTAYGQAVVIDPTTQGVRPLVAGDSALTVIYGITVRPFPQQLRTGGDAGSTLNSGTPPTSGVIDVLRRGFIMVPLPAGQTPVKGAAVDVWFAASSGAHVQSGFEAVHTGGSSLTLAEGQTTFQGGVDSANVAEVAFNI